MCNNSGKGVVETCKLGVVEIYKLVEAAAVIYTCKLVVVGICRLEEVVEETCTCK